MKHKPVDQFKPDDWVTYFRRLVMEHYETPLVTPAASLRRKFEKLLKELESPYILAMAIEHVLIEGRGFVQAVGPGDRMLTFNTMERAVRELGGYDQPWEALYYRRFTDQPAAFDKWLDMLADARSAPAGSEARVGEHLYADWNSVGAMCLKELGKLITDIRIRAKREGELEELNLQSPRIEPEVAPETEEILKLL